MRVARLLLGAAVVTGFGMGPSMAQAAGALQTLDVQVRGASAANCTFRNDTVNEQGSFPGELKIARSGKDLQADCTGEDGKRVTFVVPASISKPNALSGVTNAILPATAYDQATGGVYEYPQTVTVDFREMAENATVIDDSLAPAAGAAADAHANAGMKMQPIMEANAVAAPGQAQVINASSKMQPVASPEDKMGLEPGKIKAAERAKAEAKKKAKAEAAAAKRRAAEEEAAAKAAAEAAAAAPVVTAPAADPAASTTTTTTTTTTAPAPVAPVPSTDTPPAETPAAAVPAPEASTGAPTPITPATEAPKTDMDKYLQGQ